MKAIVIGGGLAGLSCAVELLDQGAEVTVLEALPYLGGKAASWPDADGDTIETGLHVVPRRYENLIALLTRVGAAGNLRWCEPRFTWIDGKGGVGQIRMARLPSPLHVMFGLLGYRHLTLRERIAAHGAYAATVLAAERSRDRLDQMTIGAWMRSRGASPRVIEYTIDPASRALTFIGADQVSARVMYDWVRQFLKGRKTSQLAIVDGGLGEKVIEPVAEHIRNRGGEIRLEARVQALEGENGRVSAATLESGEALDADAFVSALPLHELRTLLGDREDADPALHGLWELETLPVISVQLWFDRKVTEIADVMFRTDGPVCILADLSNSWTELESLSGSALELIIAPAKDYIDLPDEEITEIVLEDVRRSFPRSRGAEVTKSSVVKIAESIYAAYPGAERHRPGPRTGLQNFALAGDFTRTGKAPSMEAATLSGKQAARELTAPGPDQPS